ncbi:universal stress protein family protein [mine drainage metagenome]|uniref:Universal stress protein family protein n=1 Tax=mine drainage metagenome TaxID=410659 RepID=A0A1J5QME0_9ZZZZ
MSRSRPHHWHGAEPPADHPVVVGVVPGQNPATVRQAAGLARAMGVGLVCVWVDASRTFVGEDPDGTVMTTPLDPDQDDDGHRLRVEKDMNHQLKEHLAGVDVPWLFVYTVGEEARALSAVAVDHDASVIAVGPRRHGLSGWMNELVGGSVAGRLAHTQHRPVTILSAERQEHA